MSKLEMAHILGTVRNMFLSTPDFRKTTNKKIIPIVDYFMSGLALFIMKFPSLLQFDAKREKPTIKNNLTNLFQIGDKVPCDTQLRETLDEYDPLVYIRPAFKNNIALTEKYGLLNQFEFIDGHILCAADGTGEFSSKKVHCDQCCTKTTKNGIVHYHQMLGAVLVHPENRIVIPIGAEPILKQDGEKKNDCEINASKRLLPYIKKTFPGIKLIFTLDALFGNAPHINLIKSIGCKFIITVKSNNKHIFSQVNHLEEDGKITHVETEHNEFSYKFRFVNGIQLNKSNPNILVNFIEVWETNKKGKVKHFAWITDIQLTSHNLLLVMKGGRARWKIENETFNTLKNQDYNFEHNYGHGNKFLANALMMLMFLAFQIDQINELASHLFQTTLKVTGSRISLWEDIRSVFKFFHIDSWKQMYKMLIASQTGKEYGSAPQAP